MTAAMTVGSLFAGIGGFDEGLRRAGFETRWQVEIDERCREVLARHFPAAKRYGDIREVDPRDLEPVDLVCGGFPCTDLSLAGKRAGLAGEQSGLFYEFVRILAGLRPRWVLIENVPGLLSGCGCTACRAIGRILRVHAWFRERKGLVKCPVCIAGERMLKSHSGRNMSIVLHRLAELGYGYAYRVLDAQYDGLAQRRKRVFIVADSATPLGCSAKVLFESESCTWSPPPRRRPQPGAAGGNRGGVAASSGEVADVVTASYGKGAGSRDGKERTLVAYASRPDGSIAAVDVAPTLDARAADGPRRNQGGVMVTGCLTGSLGKGGPDDNQARAGFLVVSEVCGPLVSARRGVPSAEQAAEGQLVVAFQQNQRDIAHTLTGEGHDASEDGTGRGVPLVVGIMHENIGGNLAMADHARALRAGASHSYQMLVQPTLGIRRLMPIENERLQGFPPTLEWRVESMTRDEFCAALLASGAIKVTPESGEVWVTRGPGGCPLERPRRVLGSGCSGYLVASFRLGGHRMQVRLHRLVWIAAHGIPKTDLAVCHQNNNKHDNRAANLYLATHEQNSRDAKRDGLYPCGDDHPTRKLSTARAEQLVDDYKHGLGTMQNLAERYGISKSRVQQLVSMRGWLDGLGLSDSAKYRALGNAVAVPVAAWIGKRLMEVSRAHEVDT
jgi:DNA (cytosine-5)-methyltransferase 1